MKGRDRSGAGTVAIGACLTIVLMGGVGRSRAQSPEVDAIVYQAPGLRIVRGLDRHGGPTLLLTNLDDDGNRLLPAEAGGSPACPPDAAEAPAPAPPGPAEDEPERAPIIVININNEAAPPATRETEASPWIVPVVAFGGLPGRFRYPERQPFLGYGTGISSPSWLGGLGLNAGNRFGLKTGRPCGDGYDCLFAPSTSRP